jgi:hypothetical protein
VADSTKLRSYLRRTACPCCNASTAAARNKVCSFPRAEDIDLEQHGRFLSGYEPHRVFFTYLRCGRCDAWYCPIYYNPKQLARLYEAQPENMVDVAIGSRERTQKGYVELLRRHSPMVGGLLEIGVDIGLFAAECARVGKFDRYWLFEPNRAVHGQLAQRLTGIGASIRIMALVVDVPPESISTAVMIHVLDHVLEPREMLQSIFRSVQPGGVVMIVTHNGRSWLARLLGRRWPPYTLQHPQLFSPRAMRSLASSVGFEVLEVTRTTNFFPVTFLVNAALKVFGVPAKWVPVHGRLEVGVRIGNICTMLRRPR